MPSTPVQQTTPDPDQAAPVEQRRFPCAQCGGKLQFAPGTDELTCPYCSHRNTIPKSEDFVEERDFTAALAKVRETHETTRHDSVKCDACGAHPKMDAGATSMRCPFCGSNIVSQARTETVLKPDAVLPFAIDERKARDAFRAWVRSLWFAPNELRNFVREESRLRGMYIPSWTYDSTVTTWYAGRRGDYYYVPVTYTTVVNGKPQTRTRMDRRTRWSPASGTVVNSFDDILILATSSLPAAHAAQLEPWDLKAAAPYADEYLSGFDSESYTISLEDGFTQARAVMAPEIERSIRADIGGDEQQVVSTKDRFDAITFKHLLLPVWISAYRYRGKAFRILINARTGEVQGERPYSAVKITLAVLLGLAVAAVVVAFIAAANR